MFRLNAYLFAQAAIVSTAAAPVGMSTGEWIALASLFIVVGGGIYKAGVASQKAQSVEALVGGALKELTTKVDTILQGQVEDARWKENIEGRVGRIEGDASIHTHQRASDR